MESQILVGLAKWERMAWTCTHSLGPISWASQKPSNVGSLSFPLTYTAPFFAKGFFLLAITKDSGSSKTMFDQKVLFGKLNGIDWLDFIGNLLIRGLVLTGCMADFNISWSTPKSQIFMVLLIRICGDGFAYLPNPNLVPMLPPETSLALCCLQSDNSRLLPFPSGWLVQSSHWGSAVLLHHLKQQDLWEQTLMEQNNLQNTR